MSRHEVIAPLVVARVEDGSVRYLYQGAPVPTSELAKGELARLRDGGFIAAVPEPKSTTGSDGPATGAEVPAGNASLEVWHAYATSKGATAEQLDGRTRDQLRDQYSQ